MPTSPQSEGSPIEGANESAEARSSIDEGRRGSGTDQAATRANLKRGRDALAESGQAAANASSSASDGVGKKAKTIKGAPRSPPQKDHDDDDEQDPHVLPLTAASGSGTAPGREAQYVGEVRKGVEAMTHGDGRSGVEERQENEEMVDDSAGEIRGNRSTRSEVELGTDDEEDDTEQMQLDGKGIGVTPKRPESQQSDYQVPGIANRPDTPASLTGSEIDPNQRELHDVDHSSSAQGESAKHGTKRKMAIRTPSSVPLDGMAKGAKKVKDDADEDAVDHDVGEPPKSAEPSIASVNMDAGESSKQDPETSIVTKTGQTKPSSDDPVPPAPTPAKKKPQATFGNFASKASPFSASKASAGSVFESSASGSDFAAKAAAAVREANGIASPSTAQTPATPSSAPVKKPQATFGSFSSSSSPFASTGLKHTSAFSSQPVASSSSSSATTHSGSAFGKPSSSGGGKAFSGWGQASASKSAWDSPAPKGPAKSKNPAQDDEDGEEGSSKAESVKADKSESFKDMLEKREDDAVEDPEKKMDMEAQALHTGEEDEQTLHQVRTKLFVMEADGAWKERATGSVHLNVRLSDGGGPRLVMRAEGVFRLILNVNLFPGMFSEISGEKYLKVVAMEDGATKSFLLRFATAKAAAELRSKMAEFIAGENGKRSRESTKFGGEGAEDSAV